MRYNLRVNISQWKPWLTYFGDVQHSDQHISIVFIGICWPEGCTSSKSVKHCVYWYMLTRRLYITKISQTVCLLWYVNPKVVQWKPWLTYFGDVQHSDQHISVKAMFDLFWWGTTVKLCVYCEMLTRRLYLIKISSALCSFGICWPADCTSPKSVMRCAQSDMLTRRLYVFGEVSPK
jgi:hypothetical protein